MSEPFTLAVDPINTVCSYVRHQHIFSAEERDILRRVVEYTLKNWPNLLYAVHECQGQLIENGNQRGIDWKIFVTTDIHVIALARQNQFEAAMNLFADEFRGLMDTLYSDCQQEHYRQFVKEYLERRTK